jgi:hypothetical protein
MTQIEKMFTVAGTATQNGVTKARFANDMVSRVKILSKHGCTDINLVELPRPMTKLEALKYLQEIGVTQGSAGEAVSAKLAEKSQVARRKEVSVPAAKIKTTQSKKINTDVVSSDSLNTNESQVENV